MVPRFAAKAARGKILDCNGETLADSKDVFTLYARPNAVKDKTAVATEIAEALDMEYQTVFDKLNTNVGEVTVKRKIDAQSAYELRKRT